MKTLINAALTCSFNQDPSLPQITADNLKTALEQALYTIIHGKQGKPLTEEKRTELQTLVNTFLIVLSDCLVTYLLLPRPGRADRSSVLTEVDPKTLRGYSPGRELSMAFVGIFRRLIQTQVQTPQNYFPGDFLLDWWLATTPTKPANAWQSLLVNTGNPGNGN